MDVGLLRRNAGNSALSEYLSRGRSPFSDYYIYLVGKSPTIMKKTVLVVVALLSAALFTSCKSALPSRFDSFVSSVEKHCDSYSPDDWTKANERFEKLLQEYKDKRSAFNSEQKRRINSAIVRYSKEVAKSGIRDVKSALEDILEQLPSLIDEAKSFINELGTELGITLSE